MRIRFWGTRGSLPAPLTAGDVTEKIATALDAANGRRFDTPEAMRAFIDGLPFSVARTFGGNSSCVQIDEGGPCYILCDLGSGARLFGAEALKRHGEFTPQTYHVFMSHLHWDHIMGFPFFPPAYIPGNRILIYGCHADLEQAFRRQHAAPSFPVDYSELKATIEFIRLEPGRTCEAAGLRVTPKLQRHGGDSYGFRFERDGKTVVYSTDSEHRPDEPAETEAFVRFFRDADLVIFDAMYSFADAVSVREDWGHSSNVVGVELCQMAGAKRLCLFHHEPANDDAQLERLLKETTRLEEITRGDQPLQITSAYDGMVVEI